MIYTQSRFAVSSLVLAVFVTVLACTPRQPASVLNPGPVTPSRFETYFPATPAGQTAKAHVLASMAHGKDAEAKYQTSLTALRAEPGAAEALNAAYRGVPENQYLLRTMLVQGLKELQSPAALPFLSAIALDKIPPDRQKSAEINTRTDEVVIRVTAVEGISRLAAAGSQEANEVLLRLISSHEDLTVRQMAARGYLTSPSGNVEEKQQQLRRMLPQNEHWYLTTALTEIKRVPHPQMPATFALDTKRSTNPPKVKP